MEKTLPSAMTPVGLLIHFELPTSDEQLSAWPRTYASSAEPVGEIIEEKAYRRAPLRSMMQAYHFFGAFALLTNPCTVAVRCDPRR